MTMSGTEVNMWFSLGLRGRPQHQDFASSVRSAPPYTG
jgi:hypothetical protein